jgi:glutathione S-transferase
MELYFAPLACSLASRIALYESGQDARLIQVDTKAKRTEDGSDFYAVNPMGQVPTLVTDENRRLTENVAILQYIADRRPGVGLAPEGEERYRLQQWLSFISTELHKVVFIPLLDSKAPEGAKAYAREKMGPRMAHLERHLGACAFLLDRFTVADAYLVTVLNWAVHLKIDLAEWPSVALYFKRMHERPAVARAFSEELALFRAEQARRAA